jgi:hypothetical protein
VTLYLGLGFNDQGEMIPFQGGTNEDVVHRMYTALNSEGNGAEKHLEVFWYTSTDQTRPLDAAIKKRNCHGASRPLAWPRGAGLDDDVGLFCTVKFMSVDDQIAILGSGNHGMRPNFFPPFSLFTSSPLRRKRYLLSNPRQYRYTILVSLAGG